MTRIAVYGAGGVGGYFGARLAQAGAEVHFLARGAHLQALREHGLKVRSVKGDFQVQVRATDDPADIDTALLRAVHPAADELELGVREHAFDRGLTDAAGGPLNDAVHQSNPGR